MIDQQERNGTSRGHRYRDGERNIQFDPIFDCHRSVPQLSRRHVIIDRWLWRTNVAATEVFFRRGMQPPGRRHSVGRTIGGHPVGLVLKFNVTVCFGVL
jgi:hypothetical protein